MPNKAAFLLGDFNLNALDYETNETLKNIFNVIFQNGFLRTNICLKKLRKSLKQVIINAN